MALAITLEKPLLPGMMNPGLHRIPLIAGTAEQVRTTPAAPLEFTLRPADVATYSAEIGSDLDRYCTIITNTSLLVILNITLKQNNQLKKGSAPTPSVRTKVSRSVGDEEQKC